MINFIRKNVYIIVIFIITLSIGFLTFLTFIDKSFIKLNEFNLQLLLILNIALLLIFFFIIYREISKSLKLNISNIRDSKGNLKYITFFSLFTLIPSILIAVFSLFLFSFALEQYLNKKITTAVNNSYEIAKNYVDDARNQIEADIILVTLDLNKNIDLFYDNPKKFQNILLAQKFLRRLDEIHLVDSLGNKIISASNSEEDFIPPNTKALDLASSKNEPIKIIDAIQNRSSAIFKLDNYIDTYLYIVKILDSQIVNYLKESEEAINFYYTVEDKRTGIRISFILIYLVVVSLLLFLSISLAIRFSSRFFTSINNLIDASSRISKGNLDVKVPILQSDKELETLNENFNLMIDKLKTQQEKLLLTERHEAWENVARKLAHEIKNPLTPIQLSIDRIKEKYATYIENQNKPEFENYLKTINKQVLQIETLVNEFSDFARMPKPILKENDVVEIIQTNINLLKEIDKNILINFSCDLDKLFIKCDNEQISRVILNLIKNSIESIQEKAIKTPDFVKNINIEMIKKNDYIEINIEDNGIGFSTSKLSDILKPYFTTKMKGSGLGLSIVNKIINDHNGKLEFISNTDGAKVKIILPINVS